MNTLEDIDYKDVARRAIQDCADLAGEADCLRDILEKLLENPMDPGAQDEARATLMLASESGQFVQ